MNTKSAILVASLVLNAGCMDWKPLPPEQPSNCTLDNSCTDGGIPDPCASATPPDTCIPPPACPGGGTMLPGVCDTIEQLAMAGDTTCARISDGTVRCWGSNKYGKLGQSSSVVSLKTPTVVPGLSEVTHLGGGGDSFCAVRKDTSAVCWGVNDNGQLGAGHTDACPGGYFNCPANAVPKPVCESGSHDAGFCSSLLGVRKIFTGPTHSCATMTNGTVKCWGYNYAGALGDNTEITRVNPVSVCGTSVCSADVNLGVGPSAMIDELALSWHYTCATQPQRNTMYCWGDNNNGVMAMDPNASNKQLIPRELTSVPFEGRTPVAIAAGASQVCAIVSDGTTANNRVRCWGYGGNGQLGNSSTNFYFNPVTVCSQQGCGSLLQGASALTAGLDSFCATSQGAVYCWGKNDEGQHGSGSLSTVNPQFTTYAVPSLVSATFGGTKIFASPDDPFYCASAPKEAGVLCWGAGYLGNGTESATSPTPESPIW